jgi:hypothetical protein
MTNQATYCPEDNKLRLYVGRVPRDEYEKLRADGWVSTPKQSEAGKGEFAATWTPSRRDTALEYGEGIILDEDAGPAERAADRAERFGGYRDKREGEATGHADRYDAGPAVHGYQSQARAERAAVRHDRVADRAGDAWSKAEYWTRRTAGVISHALYLSGPGVRMGRIKTLEAELRGMLKRWEDSGGEPTGWAADWKTHYEMRLAYENQMLEAQGGRAAFVEMQPGGRLGSKLIVKVNKSNVTGRVVSVDVLGPYCQSWAYRKSNLAGVTAFSLYQIETERLPENAYTPPTAESLAELAEYEKTRKAAAASVKAKTTPCPLVNPTDADAERLQLRLNSEHLERLESWQRDSWKPGEVLRIQHGPRRDHDHHPRIRAAGHRGRGRDGGRRVPNLQPEDRKVSLQDHGRPLRSALYRP